jgi:hypothetical protein
MSRDNPSGADDQQETREGILRDCTQGTASAVKIQSDPYGDIGSQTEMIWPSISIRDSGVTKVPKVAKFLVG